MILLECNSKMEYVCQLVDHIIKFELETAGIAVVRNNERVFHSELAPMTIYNGFFEGWEFLRENYHYTARTRTNPIPVDINDLFMEKIENGNEVNHIQAGYSSMFFDGKMVVPSSSRGPFESMVRCGMIDAGEKNNIAYDDMINEEAIKVIQIYYIYTQKGLDAFVSLLRSRQSNNITGNGEQIEPMYAGNRTCPKCGNKKPFSDFTGETCNKCFDLGRFGEKT